MTLESAGRDSSHPNVGLEHRDVALVAELLEPLQRIPRRVLPDVSALHHDAASLRTAVPGELAGQQTVVEREEREEVRDRTARRPAAPRARPPVRAGCSGSARRRSADSVRMPRSRPRRSASRRDWSDRSSGSFLRARDRPAPRSSRRSGWPASGTCSWYRSIQSVRSRRSDCSIATRTYERDVFAAVTAYPMSRPG